MSTRLNITKEVAKQLGLLRGAYEAYYELTGNVDIYTFERAYKGRWNSRYEFAEHHAYVLKDIYSGIGKRFRVYNMKAFTNCIFAKQFFFKDGYVFER